MDAPNSKIFLSIELEFQPLHFENTPVEALRRRPVFSDPNLASDFKNAPIVSLFLLPRMR